MTERQQPRRILGLPLPTVVVLLIFLGIAAFFAVTEHTAHLFGAVPYLLLLASLVLHLFMLGSHQHTGKREADPRVTSASEEEDT